jgi:hypothetical protein
VKDILTLCSVDEDEIDDQCEALRRKLEKERQDGKDLGPNAKRLKSHQVHDLAKAKAEESDRMRKALGISEDYEEGSHWRKQEERLRESLAKREAEDDEKAERAKDARRYKEDDSDGAAPDDTRTTSEDIRLDNKMQKQAKQWPLEVVSEQCICHQTAQEHVHRHQWPFLAGRHCVYETAKRSATPPTLQRGVSH